MKQTLWVLALLMSACCMSLTGCKPSLPDDVLSQGKMEDILYDYHLALAMVQNEGAMRRSALSTRMPCCESMM